MSTSGLSPTTAIGKVLVKNANRCVLLVVKPTEKCPCTYLNVVLNSSPIIRRADKSTIAAFQPKRCETSDGNAIQPGMSRIDTNDILKVYAYRYKNTIFPTGSLKEWFDLEQFSDIFDTVYDAETASEPKPESITVPIVEENVNVNGDAKDKANATAVETAQKMAIANANTIMTVLSAKGEFNWKLQIIPNTHEDGTIEKFTVSIDIVIPVKE